MDAKDKAEPTKMNKHQRILKARKEKRDRLAEGRRRRAFAIMGRDKMGKIRERTLGPKQIRGLGPAGIKPTPLKADPEMLMKSGELVSEAKVTNDLLRTMIATGIGVTYT